MRPATWLVALCRKELQPARRNLGHRLLTADRLQGHSGPERLLAFSWTSLRSYPERCPLYRCLKNRKSSLPARPAGLWKHLPGAGRVSCGADAAKRPTQGDLSQATTRSSAPGQISHRCLLSTENSAAWPCLHSRRRRCSTPTPAAGRSLCSPGTRHRAEVGSSEESYYQDRPDTHKSPWPGAVWSALRVETLQSD